MQHVSASNRITEEEIASILSLITVNYTKSFQTKTYRSCIVSAMNLDTYRHILKGKMPSVIHHPQRRCLQQPLTFVPFPSPLAPKCFCNLKNYHLTSKQIVTGII